MLFYSMKIEELYRLYLDSTGVNTDTRTIQKGQLFFALSGENFNGNQFAQQAIEKGAKMAIIDDENFQNPHTLYVENTLESLQELAAFHRDQLQIPIIGLTGSNGKTTSKELLHTALIQKYNVTATKGNLNNHIGVPLTLLRVKNDDDIAIIEMGANGPDDIKELCEIAKPTHGFITNIGKAHLEGFGGQAGVLSAKKQLYDYLSSSKGIIFYNQDDPLLNSILPSNTTNIAYGKEEPQLNASIIDCNPYLTFSLNGTHIKSQLTGVYNFYNFLTASSVAHYFKVDNSQLKDAFESYVPSNARSQIEKGKNTLIIDAYNANPSSMKLAIENLSGMSGKRFVILGDMRELGKYASEEHQNICDQLSNSGLNEGILVGEEFMKCNSPLNRASNTEDAIKLLQDYNLSEQTILIKGSRGIALEKVLPSLR